MSALRNARIYYLHPLLAGNLAQCESHLDRCRAMGFNQVLIAPPFAPGQARTLFVTQDHERAHPALDTASADAYLSGLARRCRERGLSLWLDLCADRLGAGHPLAAAHPRWFVPEGGETDALDPRREPQDVVALCFHHDSPERTAQITAWWIARVRRWLDAGLSGFRCLGLQSTPAAFWSALISAGRAHQPECRFIAWTPGLGWQQAELLREAGFDAMASSLCWWDYRAGWFADEYERLARATPLLTFAEAPFDTRLARYLAPEQRVIASRRALWFSAAVGGPWLLPMGCEFGAQAPLDLHRGTPAKFEQLVQRPVHDYTADIKAINAQLAHAPAASRLQLRALSAPGADVAAFLRAELADPRQAKQAELILANADLAAAHAVPREQILPLAGGRLGEFETEGAAPFSSDAFAELAPGELRVLRARCSPPLLAPASARNRRAINAATRAPRIAIERVRPCLDGGRFAVRRIAGEMLHVTADIFIDGHEQIAVVLIWRACGESEWQELPMRALGNDLWSGEFPLPRLGRYEYSVMAWFDAYASFHHGLVKKHAAGVDSALELEEGRLLLEQIAAEGEGQTAPVARLAARLARLKPAQRLETLLATETTALVASARHRPHRVLFEPALPVEAERIAARYASWYELFPRSQTSEASVHGRFEDVIPRLPALRDMGFDVLYFPPIHPIGTTNRKGRNNTLTAAPDDPGSPYAIGSDEGGHEAIHPQLGTREDFRRLREAAAEQGLELALDFAIQCSPDHPWLKSHPGWFAWRPDGSMRYAENPPKKYQDIVNVDFYADDALPSLWLALRDVVLGWVAEGVKIFRVDNPHTKPLPFWEWLIADVRGRDPEVIFLAEAFTRPAMMGRLGKIGFSQSYTYFTWRNTKQELSEYLTQLNSAPLSEFYRPHFFVNTPDINPYFLQTSGRAGFLIRAALATMGSGLWGMYSGFELCESAALPGKEEYLDSEKYEIRVRDFQAPGNIVGVITQLNRIRRHNPALQTHLGFCLYNAFNERILYFGKRTADLRNFILVAVSLDPHQAQEAQFELPLWEFGLPDHAALHGEDLMSGHRWTWQGKTQFMRIEPWHLPFGIWRVST